jgi:hypothetical protein
MAITTEAWVLPLGPERPERGALRRESLTLPSLAAGEVLVEPIYGSWEANMTHAVSRRPIDVCRLRGEERIVLGNAGVVRVLDPNGSAHREGSLCIVFANSDVDPYGYMRDVYAYDAKNTVGLLAKRTKLRAEALLPIPDGSRHPIERWAGFSLKYLAAWSNWQVAYGCWRVQMSEEDMAAPYVWGWGGATTLAELSLAQKLGFPAAMIASKDSRLHTIAELGITPIDRRAFPNISFDGAAFAKDPEAGARYRVSERTFLAAVQEHTRGEGVSIFLDYIGGPVWKATLKALGRQAVLATAGWLGGMTMSTLRATECIQRHTHVHTHGARIKEGPAAVRYAEEHGWLPPAHSSMTSWDAIGTLADRHVDEAVEEYFALYQVNPL